MKNRKTGVRPQLFPGKTGVRPQLFPVDYPAVVDINGVAWKAVELPSQFIENWCREKEALDLISAHVDRGERIRKKTG